MAERIRNVLVPTEKFAEIKGGKRREGQRKIYPGYILVEMQLDESTSVPVRETAGIGDFVGAHGMPDADGAATRSRSSAQMKPGPTARSPSSRSTSRWATSVKIKEGPFENFDGVVDEVNAQKGLVRVIVTIFGRETPGGTRVLAGRGDLTRTARSTRAPIRRRDL